MPKRSNDFQTLVKVIQDALAAVDGATVTESAMLPEPDGTLREVDILLERRVSDIQLRVAIECRDRSRKSDVEWIDGLIGKYRNLRIDRVVAVSRNGFSKTAATKAAASNIDLRVLKECLAHEWPSEFFQIGMAAFEFSPTQYSADISFDPALVETVTPDTPVEIADSGHSPTLAAIVHDCFAKEVAPKIKKHIEQEFLSRSPTLKELSRIWEFTTDVEINGVWLVTSSQTRHRITAMKFSVTAKSDTTVMPVQRLRYGEAAVATIGQQIIGTTTNELRVVQVAGQSRLNVNASKRPRK